MQIYTGHGMAQSACETQQQNAFITSETTRSSDTQLAHTNPISIILSDRKLHTEHTDIQSADTSATSTAMSTPEKTVPSRCFVVALTATFSDRMLVLATLPWINGCIRVWRQKL